MTRRALLFAIVLAAPVLLAQQNEIVAWDNGVPYVYDSSGNVRQIGNDKFAYDHAGRLIQATVNGVRRDYEYDRYGNRTKCVQDKATTMEGDCQGYSIDSDNNHVLGATYDPNGSGNVTAIGTHGYTFDAFNMMVRDQAGEAREFIYTADDERVGTFSAGSRTWRWTVRDQSSRVLREFTSSGGANGTSSFQWTKDFIWRDAMLLATMQPEGSSTTTYHYHLDHLGTPRRITDRNDNLVGFHDYFAFGAQKEGRQEPSFTRIRYTGHERDVANDRLGTLDYMHARYYSSELGRFLTIDPGKDFDPKQPQSWNLYAYVRNNPMTNTDPTGRRVLVMCGAGNQCVANVTAEIVHDPTNAAEVATANAFKSGAEGYWNSKTVALQNGGSLTFNIQLTLVTRGQENPTVDQVNVVNGTGRANIQHPNHTVGGANNHTRIQPPDRGTIYTTDNTGNPHGMAGIAPHEVGHMMGLPELSTGTVSQIVDTPQHSIMEMAAPNNSPDIASFMFSQANWESVIFWFPFGFF